jgi:hypothetical protein
MLKSAEEFVEFSNSCGSGYLKTWKGLSMWATFSDSPDVVNDESRLRLYIKSRLMLEGFSDLACSTVAIMVYASFLGKSENGKA